MSPDDWRRARAHKAMLTVIALCLVWISLGGPSLLPGVGAQSTADVVIGGWRDGLLYFV